MPSSLAIRTGAWYGDYVLELPVPNNWDTNILWPQTPPQLTKTQISDILQNPVGQPSIKNLCKGKSRPLIIVDDLNRPTPAKSIIHILLKYFKDKKIPLRDVSILMATGSHGKPATGALLKKVGTEASVSCRLLIHDCFHGNVRLGKTSFNTRVYANRALLESDLVIGIGGIYPNYTAGFSGGTKLALGVLGLQSIFDLHYRHRDAGWGSVEVENSFRKDLNEISRMIGLKTIITLQINADREIIRIDCGDSQKYFPEALDFCQRTFSTPSLNDENVVITNTYPNDLSLTFARMKGFWPLKRCQPSSSRIAIASCEEGVGLHNIFPFLNIPRFHKIRHLYRLIRAFSPEFPKKVIKRIHRRMLVSLKANSNEKIHVHPIWLYRPSQHRVQLPSKIPGMMQLYQWSKVLQVVQKEQAYCKRLKVIVFPCAALQFTN